MAYINGKEILFSPTVNITSSVIDNVEVQLDFTNGNQTESLPDGYSAKSVTIIQPENLIPENIAKDVNIAGIIGTHEGGGSVEGTAIVTFCDYDGTELYSRLVFIGDDCADPVAQGKINTPTKASDVQYNYAFNGWSDTQGGAASSTALKNITADKTVYAGYASSLVYYTVRFYDGDTLMQESQVAYGETAIPPDTTKDGYGFMGWSPSDLVITANTDFYGYWEAKHTDENGQILDSWETIFASIADGNYKTYYSVGNYKPLDTGADGVVNMQIVAFDLDVKADGSGKAPITWIAKELLLTKKGHYPSNEKTTTWLYYSKVRAYLVDTVTKNLPSAVRDAIVPVNKITSCWNNTTRVAENLESTETLWIPSTYEIGGQNGEGTGVHYTYTTTNKNPVYRKNNTTNKKKCVTGESTPVSWWLRTSYNLNNKDYNHVGDSGTVFTVSYGQTYDIGICLCFCT